MNTQSYQQYAVVDASPVERAAFIRRTYAHVAGAVLAFIGIEVALFQTGAAQALTATFLSGKWSWLMVMVGFMAVSWIAQKWAQSPTSSGSQYLGLSIFVIAEAIIFAPLLLIASTMASDIIPMSGLITALLFGGLTFTAFTTRKDFTFLGGILKVGGFVAIGIIVAAIAFGFNLGLLFSSVMVLFAGASILYNTSQIQHHYSTTQHVAAALSLFASIALLFWYVLRILMSFSSRD